MVTVRPTIKYYPGNCELDDTWQGDGACRLYAGYPSALENLEKWELTNQEFFCQS